jgi:hypothetical protein
VNGLCNGLPFADGQSRQDHVLPARDWQGVHWISFHMVPAVLAVLVNGLPAKNHDRAPWMEYYDTARCVDRRPEPSKRSFASLHVETFLDDLSSKMTGDRDLACLFANVFPNTLDTTVRQTLNDSFVITGDIDAMWLRDSVNQLLPYVPLADVNISNLLAGVLRTQTRQVLADPYANAHYDIGNGGPSPNAHDDTSSPSAQCAAAARGNGTLPDPSDRRRQGMVAGIYERKYELDSLLAFLKLGRVIYGAVSSRDAAGDLTVDPFAPFDAVWLSAVGAVLDVLEAQVGDRRSTSGAAHTLICLFNVSCSHLRSSRAPRPRPTPGSRAAPPTRSHVATLTAKARSHRWLTASALQRRTPGWCDLPSARFRDRRPNSGAYARAGAAVLMSRVRSCPLEQSDDACTFAYHIPSNAMAVVELNHTARMLRALPDGSLPAPLAVQLRGSHRPRTRRVSPGVQSLTAACALAVVQVWLAARCEAIAASITRGIAQFGVVDRPDLGGSGTALQRNLGLVPVCARSDGL